MNRMGRRLLAVLPWFAIAVLSCGTVLIVMMRLRPEGLWPSDVRQRELHAADETLALDAGADPVPAQPR